MKKKTRFSKWWSIRRYVGSLFQIAAWYICDAHDTWVIDYRDNQDRLFSVNCTGFYSMARIRARELNGKIVGVEIGTVDAPEWG